MFLRRGKVPASRENSRRGVVKRGLTVHARELVAQERLRCVPLRLLVALRERIGLDQISRFEDQLELAIELGLADAGLRPEVMVFMDAHVAFGRLLEFDAWRGGCDLVDIEAASLLHR